MLLVRSVWMILAATHAVAAAAAVADTSLLPNGDFSQATQFGGWSCSVMPDARGGSFSWSGDDADGDASSGSMALTAVASCPDPASPLCVLGSVICRSSCFAARPGAAYAFGGKSRLVGGVGLGLYFGCYQYTNASCDLGPSPLGNPDMAADATWNSLPVMTAGTFDANTHSVSCSTQASAPPVATSVATYEFDDLVFYTDDIFFAGFDP